MAEGPFPHSLRERESDFPSLVDGVTRSGGRSGQGRAGQGRAREASASGLSSVASGRMHRLDRWTGAAIGRNRLKKRIRMVASSLTPGFQGTRETRPGRDAMSPALSVMGKSIN